jgi:dipeptidyl aminopeptidase/acylaminoacyl peptidase
MKLTSTGALIATGYPRWSPDGRLIAFHSNFEGQSDVYVIAAAGGKPGNLTSHPANDAFPSFSHDGQWIYFSSNRLGENHIWKLPASGGEAIQVTKSVGYVPAESPDGTYVYYIETFDKPSPLWRVPSSGGTPEKVLDGIVLGNFVVLDRGIYYIDMPSGQGGIHYLDSPSGETRLQYFDFAKRKSTTLARDLGKVDLPLSVSPDGRTILYTRLEKSVDDLVLVENFR